MHTMLIYIVFEMPVGLLAPYLIAMAAYSGFPTFGPTLRPCLQHEIYPSGTKNIEKCK